MDSLHQSKIDKFLIFAFITVVMGAYMVSTGAVDFKNTLLWFFRCGVEVRVTV